METSSNPRVIKPSNITGKASFLDLPGELRNRIYRFYLQNGPIVADSDTFPQPPLLFVPKQINEEASSIYYGEASIDIYIHYYSAGKLDGIEHRRPVSTVAERRTIPVRIVCVQTEGTRPADSTTLTSKNAAAGYGQLRQRESMAAVQIPTMFEACNTCLSRLMSSVSENIKLPSIEDSSLPAKTRGFPTLVRNIKSFAALMDHVCAARLRNSRRFCSVLPAR